MTLARDIKVGDRIAGIPGFRVNWLERDGNWITLHGRRGARGRFCHAGEDVRTLPAEGALRNIRIPVRLIRPGDEIIGYGRVREVTRLSPEDMAVLSFDTDRRDRFTNDCMLWINRRRNAAGQ